MLSVALTGNVASGKSTVAGIWREAGVPVVSADELARAAVRPGTEGLEAVRGAFGDEVVGGDGALDRNRLRDLAFRDPSARRRLEAILHPRITELREEWLNARAREGHPLVVSEIPLLFEAGLEALPDVIVVVHAPEGERRRRLIEDRGLSAEEADRLMASQGDPVRKLERGSYVLQNGGTVEELKREALGLLATLRWSAGRGPGGERGAR
jgi:dephospho-CoA kinase